MTRQRAILGMACAIGAGCGLETGRPPAPAAAASARSPSKPAAADGVALAPAREPPSRPGAGVRKPAPRPTNPSPIVNPTPVAPQDLPGMVMVFGMMTCSGTLISRDTVLTAAHCVCTDSDVGGNVCNPDVEVRFGPDENLLTDSRTGHATWHPGYDPSWLDSAVHDDLAVVKLDGLAPASASARPFRLPATNPPTGSPVLLAGFGYTGGDCTGPLGSLNSDVANVDDYEDSGKIMTFFDPVFCKGDSGGAVLDPVGRKLEGVPSLNAWSLSHGSISKAIATAPYHDWIASFLGPFVTFRQSYAEPAPRLDFGQPSSWEAISGDFDHDGKGDYARVGATGAWVFYGDGDGGFRRRFQSYVDDPVPLDFGAPSPWETITGDFDGDGGTDYARLGSTGAFLFFENANRTFSRGFQSYVDDPVPLDFGIPSPWQTVTGDFNGDGRTDYARLGATGAFLFVGNADRSFTRHFQSYVDDPVPLDFGAPSIWQSITGDFDGDGRTDYARLGATDAWLFFGNADGTFRRELQSYVDDPVPLDFGLPSPWRPITGDFNGDGKTDYARLGATDAWLFFGRADRTFKRGFQSYLDQWPPLDFDPGSTWQPFTGDFDGDGRTDYAWIGNSGAWLFHGNADETFRRDFQVHDLVGFGDPGHFQVVTGNFGGDGRTAYARLGGTQAYVFLHP
jgi:hypothetical protein